MVSKDRDYRVRAQKFYDDEIGQLTDAFNLMLTRIEEQNSEITSFNRDLELKVTERTNELELVNTGLKLKNDFVGTIFDASIDVIGVFDIELNYVMLNKYAQQLYGVSSEQVIRKNILEVFPQVTSSPMYNDLIKCSQELLFITLIINHIFQTISLKIFISRSWIKMAMFIAY